MERSWHFTAAHASLNARGGSGFNSHSSVRGVPRIP
jgi:hypothetical protein